MPALVGQVFYGAPFAVYDGSGTGTTVPGQVSADFTRAVYRNSATNAATLTITEIGSTGIYVPSFTPTSTGRWSALIVHASYGAWLVEDVDAEDYSWSTIVAAVASGVWDELRSGHVTSGSYGELFRAVVSGTAQAGSASTITLDPAAGSNDDYYKGGSVEIVSGTGGGQSRTITGYVGSTKVATVSPDWAVNPSGASSYVLRPAPTAVVGTVASLATGAVAAASLASAAANKIADHVLRRALASAAASSDGDAVSFRSLLGAARKLVNRVRLAAGVLEVYDETDAATAGTQTATTDASADPVTELDT